MNPVYRQHLIFSASLSNSTVRARKKAPAGTEGQVPLSMLLPKAIL
jgi:hypothetical protein